MNTWQMHAIYKSGELRYDIPHYLTRLKYRFKHVMDAADISVRNLSVWSGVSRKSIISLMNHDDFSQPSIRTIVNTCKILGVNVNMLIMPEGFITNDGHGEELDPLPNFMFRDFYGARLLGTSPRSKVFYSEAIKDPRLEESIDISTYTLKTANRIYDRLHDEEEFREYGRYNAGMLSVCTDIPKPTLDAYLEAKMLPSVVNLINISQALGCQPSSFIGVDKFIVPRERRVVDYYSVSRGLKTLEEATSVMQPGEWFEPEGDFVDEDEVYDR